MGKQSGIFKLPKPITGALGITKTSIKPKKTRQIIRRFHLLHKERHAYLTQLANTIMGILESNYKEKLKLHPNLNEVYLKSLNDFIKLKVFRHDLKLNQEIVLQIGAIDAELTKSGGLNKYQLASTLGQDNKRGGDSSRQLIQWLDSVTIDSGFKLKKGARALEIGCLSPENAISKSSIFDSVVRIDLNSRHRLIEQQDFMERPVPSSENEKFDLISCSLVLNFVPSARTRGEMLRLITKFLKEPTEHDSSLLFLVLPSPCITNSRYFNQEQLMFIMKALGFEEIKFREAKKIAYWLFRWKGVSHTNLHINVKKHNISSGKSKNNFCIILE